MVNDCIFIELGNFSNEGLHVNVFEFFAYLLVWTVPCLPVHFWGNASESSKDAVKVPLG